MEWVETTGKSIEAALDAALDELGVDEDEVEYEVLEEPKGGMFSRRDARIRARVRPISREKPGEQRRRRGRRPGGGRDERPARPKSGNGRSRGGGALRTGEKAREPADGDTAERSGAPRRRRRGGRGRGPRPAGTAEQSRTTEDGVSEESVSVEEQAEAAEGFTRGLVEAFGADAQVVARIDDEAVLVDITGNDLGLLIGPRGVTLQAIEDLVRTVVQRQTEGHGTRINVDVAGFRAKRREALAEFTRELAAEVRDSGREKALEPMSASDRKVVHDTVAEMEGLSTSSEGEDPRRRVVISPA